MSELGIYFFGHQHSSSSSSTPSHRRHKKKPKTCERAELVEMAQYFRSKFGLNLCRKGNLILFSDIGMPSAVREVFLECSRVRYDRITEHWFVPDFIAMHMYKCRSTVFKE